MNADMLDSPGTRIGNEILDFVPASANIRPLRDVIVIEPLPIDHGTLLNVVYRGKPVRGKVLAVGPGVYPRRYNGPKGRRTKSWLAKCFRPCDLTVGDIVDIGGLEIGGYLHPTVRWGDKEVVLAREEDVAGVIVSSENRSVSSNG